MDVDGWRQFGEWLELHREVLGLTRAAAAKEMGISYATLQDLENGGKTQRGEWIVPSPSRRILMGIAKGLRLDPLEVFTKAGAANEWVARLILSGEEPQALSGKIDQLSEQDRAYIERLVDRLLTDE